MTLTEFDAGMTEVDRLSTEAQRLIQQAAALEDQLLKRAEIEPFCPSGLMSGWTHAQTRTYHRSPRQALAAALKKEQ